MTRQLAFASLEIAPALLLQSKELAISGFMGAVVPLQQKAHEILPQLAPLIDQGVPLGDPRRAPLDKEMVMIRFQLDMLAETANEAIYAGWNATFEKIAVDQPEMKKEEILEYLKNAGLDKPAPVVFGTGQR